MASVETKPGLLELTAEMFRPAIGKIFIFKRPVGQEGAGGGCAELRLVEVKSSGNGSGRFRASFSLLFELIDGMQPLGPGLHRLEHPNFRQEDWHIARVQVFGRDPGRAYYESVFG